MLCWWGLSRAPRNTPLRLYCNPTKRNKNPTSNGVRKTVAWQKLWRGAHHGQGKKKKTHTHSRVRQNPCGFYSTALSTTAAPNQQERHFYFADRRPFLSFTTRTTTTAIFCCTTRRRSCRKACRLRDIPPRPSCGAFRASSYFDNSKKSHGPCSFKPSRCHGLVPKSPPISDSYGPIALLRSRRTPDYY